MSENASFHQDFFKLPKGAGLVRGIFTTMSMDLEELIRMAGMCLIPGCSGIGSVGLPSLRLMAERSRLRFFYDGKDPFNLRCGPTSGAPFRALATPVISDAPCFHPKIILLEYTTADAQKHFRLLVSSKNLTVAQSLETGVWLESVPHQGADKPNHNLPALVEFLRRNTKDTDVEGPLDGVGDALARVDFVLREDQADASRRSRVTVKVSGPGGLGRQDALAERLLEDAWKFKRNEDMVILSPDYETTEDAAKTLFLVKPKKEDGTELPTHGKLYYDRIAKTLWTGSANCSISGLTKNVECMVEIREAADVWEDADSGAWAGRLFGVPCVRYTEIPPEDAELKALKVALREFLESHTITIDESYQRNIEKRRTDITIPPQGQEGADPKIKIKLLPLGMGELKSDGTERWKEFSGEANVKGVYHFMGLVKEAFTHALRIKAERDSRVCEVIYWDFSWSPDPEKEAEDVFRTFIDTPWLQQYCQTRGDGPEALHRQITAMAEALLRDEPEASRRRRIEQIAAASKRYRDHFSCKEEEE